MKRLLQRLMMSGGTLNSVSPPALVFVLLGQSLNVTRGTSVQATAMPGRSFMPVAGSSIISWPFNSVNALFSGAWADLATASAFTEDVSKGQSPMAGILNELAVGTFFQRVYIGSVAIGARTIEVLSIDGAYANLQAMISRLCALARSDGYTPSVVLYSAHGESNAANSTSYATYFANGGTYYRRAQLFARQAMRNPNAIVPILLTYPAVGNIVGQTYIPIKTAIMDLAQTLPNAIDAGPIYQWPMDTDLVHPTPGGSMDRGEQVAYRARQFLQENLTVHAPRIVDCTLSGTTVVVYYDKTMVRDASLLVGSNLNTANAEDGFEWFDNGTNIAITTVVFNGDTTITLTLASAPTGTLAQQNLRYGFQTISGAPAGVPANLPGGYARSNETGRLGIYDPAYTQYAYAISQSFVAVRAP
jgi:hypothetical protein